MPSNSGSHGRNGCVRYGNHHVAVTDIAGAQRQVKSICAIADADGRAHIQVISEFLLKGSNLITKYVRSSFKRAAQSLINLLLVS